MVERSEPGSNLSAIHQSIRGIWRIDSARIVAIIARLTNDMGIAEDCAQDALMAAVEQWPAQGIPDNPAAWLAAVGKRKAIDFIRKEKTAQSHAIDVLVQQEIDSSDTANAPDVLNEDIKDDLLRLIFTACHPSLAFEAQAALALRILCGLSVPEIARAFLKSEAAISQRIVRAKRQLADERIPFEVPQPDELPERLGAVLEVVYLLFNEGYAATSGDDWLRADLCNDALRVGRILSTLMPAEPDPLGLVALMEIQASRTRARIDADGLPVLLADQDRSQWDRLAIHRGLAALQKSLRLLAESPTSSRSHIVTQAAIAACHARAPSVASTDWATIVRLYDELLRFGPSPVVELNRAVAISMASGPEDALQIVDRLAREGQLKNYHLLPSVRGDLLFRLGRFDEAHEEFMRAVAMTQNDGEKKLLIRKANQCASQR